jgi:hypothetical protein
MNIDLHIERLVLDGIDLPPGGTDQLGASVKAELRRLLSERGVSPDLANGAGLARVAAPSIEVPPGGDLAGLGRAIAGAVYGGLGS